MSSQAGESHSRQIQVGGTLYRIVGKSPMLRVEREDPDGERHYTTSYPQDVKDAIQAIRDADKKTVAPTPQASDIYKVLSIDGPNIVTDRGCVDIGTFAYADGGISKPADMDTWALIRSLVVYGPKLFRLSAALAAEACAGHPRDVTARDLVAVLAAIEKHQLPQDVPNVRTQGAGDGPKANDPIR